MFHCWKESKECLRSLLKLWNEIALCLVSSFICITEGAPAKDELLALSSTATYKVSNYRCVYASLPDKIKAFLPLGLCRDLVEVLIA